MPRKLLVGGVQRSGSVRGVAKKVAPPTAPQLSVRASHFKAPPRSPCVCDEPLRLDYDTGPPDATRNGSSLYIAPFYSPVEMKKTTPKGSNGQIHLAHVTVHSQPDSLPSTPSESGHSPSLSKGRLSEVDQGIEAGGRHSPGGSSGGSSVSRHSLSSLDSGRASGPPSSASSSASSTDVKVVNRRLSVASYEGGSPQRRSYHSSSSSIASADNGDLTPAPNVAEMVLHGLPDMEVLSSWLATLHFEEYIPLFLLAGYDMPTITRMTPEDLTAIGITKPNHRRKLKAEIAKLNISDGIPEYKPDSLREWLQLLRLDEYFDTLSQQNYNTVDKVTDLTWEDLEDIGIQKLGHQKRILLAIKRIEDINHGRRPNLYPQNSLTNNRATMPAGGCSTFPRPSTLNNVQPLQYTSQEIAISTQRTKTSPSTDSIPEMKTFQQSPIREESLFMQAVHNSAQNIAMSQYQNGVSNTVLSPTRGRSLESLHSENSIPGLSPLANSRSEPPPPPAPAPPMQHQPSSYQQQLSNNYHQNSLDCYSQPPLPAPTSVYQSSPLVSTNYQTVPPASTIYQSHQQAITMYQSQAPTSVQSGATIYQSQPPTTTIYQSHAPTSVHQGTAVYQSQPPTTTIYQSHAPTSVHQGTTVYQSQAPTSVQPRTTVYQSPPPVPPSAHQPPPPPAPNEVPKIPARDYRITDLDGEFECEGTATLNRPKGMVRIRPMAKIAAKTREEIAEAIMDIPDSEFKSLINNQTRTLDGWSSLEGSPRHGPSTVPRSSTLKRAPPPVPKRNPAKIDKPRVELPPKPKLPTPKNEVASEDFPPPPSPLPSTAGEDGAEKSPKDELFNNPLFKQRRKDSTGSATGVDVSALPFANEAAGTIKQKAARPYPSLPTTASLQRASQKKNLRDDSSNNAEHEYDVTPEAISPGDVIDDIENMLANLSDQLDEMLNDDAQK